MGFHFYLYCFDNLGDAGDSLPKYPCGKGDSVVQKPLILFDMDGTLTAIDNDTPEKELLIESSGAKARAEMKRLAISLGVPREEIEPLNRMAVVWNSSRRYAERHKFADEKTKRLMQELNIAFQKQEDLEHSMTMPLLETNEVLQCLADDSYQLGVVTSASRKGYNRIAGNSSFGGFNRFFRHSITREDCHYIKPDPEPINKVLRLMGSTDFIFVGDSDHDAFAARSAGGRFILLKNNENPEWVRDHKPDGVISSLGLLPRKITELIERK